MTPSESRLFQLSGDIYAVKSSNKLKLRQKLWKTEAGMTLCPRLQSPNFMFNLACFILILKMTHTQFYLYKFA